MSAPALKNPGMVLARTITRTSSVNRNSSTAALNSRIISRSYVFALGLPISM